MAEVTLKQGDTTPEFTTALNGVAQEFDGNESARFYMESEPKQGGGNASGDLLVNQPITETRYQNPPRVTYDFGPGETSRVGTHLAEVVVTYPDGEIQSFPAGGYYQIEITEPVARDVPPEDLDAPDITVGVVDASQVNAPALQAVETLTGSITGGQTISNIEGAGLSIDEDGDLNVANTLEDTPSHYNPFYDSNTDGVIDADVNNETTESDVVRSGELSVGGQPSPTTGLWGDSGEFVPLDSAERNVEIPIDNKSYEYAISTGSSPRFDAEALSSYTNIESLYFSFQCNLKNDSGNTSYARFESTPASEVTSTLSSNGSQKSSMIALLDLGRFRGSTAGVAMMPLIQCKVDGGTGTLKQISWSVWGKIA